jgi:hypothetical protein
MAAFLVDDESVRWGRSDYATSSSNGSAAVRAVLSKSVRVLSTHYDAPVTCGQRTGTDTTDGSGSGNP